MATPSPLSPRLKVAADQGQHRKKQKDQDTLALAELLYDMYMKRKGQK